MYLRPGNIWTDFVVRRKSIHNILGHPVSDFEAKGEISGILAEASSNESDRMKHRWDQEQHSLTHTLVIRDFADVKQSLRLTLDGEDIKDLIVFAGHDWENETETVLFTGLDSRGRSVWGKRTK
mgnify:FL=1